ncbi:M18 family aminopeptidase, partial [Clostridioides difficile]|uniref:M18 family aminopeptidase n=1 Tax=Clostridioides difficile TaxID=1496 RepID=UPI001033AF6B
MDSINFAKNLIDFIYDSPSSFHAVESTKEILDKNGFEELVLNQRWNLRVGGKYYVTKNLSAIVAFVVNSEGIERDGFRIIGSHSDSPTFSIKPNAEIEAEKSYLKLNTECYGGAILSTWLDRPLGIAGRVVLKGDSILKPNERLIDFKKPICIIPNLAIHLNRSINDGHSYNKQKDMLPLVGMLNDTLEKDNLAMVHASLNALVNTKGQHGVNVMAVFDNEEVGSSTKQGADSNMLLNILERICISMGKDREGFFESIYSSFMISSDLAHAIHPNIPEKHDPTNKPIMGKGPVIKINASQAYTSDGYSIAIYKNICREANVEYQEFVNRSDERGGSTIGPISSTHIDIPSVDVGSPILAMHSIRELGNVEDHYSIYKT